MSVKKTIDMLTKFLEKDCNGVDIPLVVRDADYIFCNLKLNVIDIDDSGYRVAEFKINTPLNIHLIDGIEVSNENLIKYLIRGNKKG